jgi:hypothetical protein
MFDYMRMSNALVQLQAPITLAAKPHPKSACQLQRSLGSKVSESRIRPTEINEVRKRIVDDVINPIQVV